MGRIQKEEDWKGYRKMRKDGKKTEREVERMKGIHEEEKG